MNKPRLMTVLEDVPARFTAEEFLELCELPPIANWNGKIELVKGVITRLAPAHIPHWNAQRVAHARLYEAMLDAPGGWIVGYQPTVRLAGDIVREPDVALLRDPGLAATGRMFDRTALFLAIEVSDSSLDIDLGIKRLNYAEAFVPHYWVIDIRNHRTHVMSDPVEGDYRERRLIPSGVAIAIPGLGKSVIID